MKKNVASQSIGCQMITAADGTAFTGTVTVYKTIDNGTQAIGTVGSGVCTHEGNGYHSYAPAQAETNGDHIAWTFTGTGAIPATIQIYTNFPQTVDNNVLAAGATGFAAIDTVVDAIKVKTDFLPSVTAGNAGGVFIAGTNAATTITTGLTTTFTGNLTGSVASVTGAVGSVTGAVGSVTGLTASNLDATISSRMPTTHIAATAGKVDGVALVDTTTTNTDMRGTDSAYTGTPPTAVAIADQVWDEALAGHLGAGSTGEALNAAGAAGDPWTTALPGAYGVGSAGYIIGNNIDAPVSTVDTVVDGIQADLSNGTDGLGALKALIDAVNTDLSNGTDGLGALKAIMDTTGVLIATGGLSAAGLATDAAQEIRDTIFQGTLTEGYATDGSAATLQQILYMIWSGIAEFAISGTTITCKKLDGTTTSMTFTLDDGTNPTSRTRAT